LQNFPSLKQPHGLLLTADIGRNGMAILPSIADVLQIGEGTPRAWLEAGKHVAVTSAPTEFGELSYRIDAEADESMNIAIKPVFRHAPGQIRLHLRNPEHKAILSVDGSPKADIDNAGETITLRNVNRSMNLRVRFSGIRR
jgi:hypothetical protein